jgi:tRNA threonylcarbamoyladenosine biosynthesis protein TsaE
MKPKLNTSFISRSPAETHAFARNFAKSLQPQDFISLSGTLGAGKTEFVRGLAEEICGSSDVTSPTFTIMNIYDPKDKNRFPIYHLDFYRIKDDREIYDLGFEEFFYGDGVSVVEWAELFPELLPKKRYSISITTLKGDAREITILKI